MIIKSSLGLSFGVVFSVLLFKRRAWPAWVGLGFGAGRAWEESDGTLISILACYLRGGALSSPGLQAASSFHESRLCFRYIPELEIAVAEATCHSEGGDIAYFRAFQASIPTLASTNLLL